MRNCTSAPTGPLGFAELLEALLLHLSLRDILFRLVVIALFATCWADTILTVASRLELICAVLYTSEIR
jgi:hypothetical protein